MRLWDVLERSLQTYGSYPSLTDPQGEVLSYAKLREEIQFRSAKLRLIIPPGSRVAVIDDQPFDEALNILTLIALHVTIVPLAVKYGEQRCSQIIEHTRPHFLYTSSKRNIASRVAAQCASCGTVIVTNDMSEGDMTTLSTQMQGEIIATDVPVAIIMYTSGSTGQPKGAVLTHANILANIADIRTYFEITPDDHIIINRSLSHASVMTGEFLYGLVCGARITFYPKPFIPRLFLNFLLRAEGTVFCSTPTIFYQLALDKSDYRLPKLRKVALMGEYLHKQVALKISSRFPDIEFYMLYGQTEAGPRITYLPYFYFNQKEGCIGKALPGMEIKIVDEDGNLSGVGIPGELVVRGPNIFWGYWNNPQLTAQKVRNGWMYTGDIVYQGEDGYLYISGRKDDMIIRAGMNIYPKEIEDAVLEDDRIREVVVFGTTDIKFGQKIHISVVPNEGVTLNEADIIDICKNKLASYQYPDAVSIVSELPRNLAGKIMRRKEGALL